MELSICQREAVTADERNILVLAGPGSGKTEILIRRIEHLVAGNTDPGKIVAFTFTRKAADEIRERLTIPGCHVGTIHSYALHFLRRTSPGLMVTNNSGTLAERFFDGRKPVYWDKLMGEYAVSGFKPDDYRGVLMDRYIEYQKRIGLLDLDLIVALAADRIDEVEPPDIEHLLVDEVQDVNAVQLRFMEKLDSSFIFKVGDLDQSIYKWQGAVPERLKNETNDRTFKLCRSYRLPVEIARAACGLIEHNETTSSPAVRGNSNSGKCCAVEFDDRETEARGIGSAIKRHNLAYSDTAVLVRTKALADEYAGLIGNTGIPTVTVKEIRKFWNSGEVRSLLDMLRLSQDPENDHLFMSVKSALSRPDGAENKRFSGSFFQIAAGLNSPGSIREKFRQCRSDNLNTPVEVLDHIRLLLLSGGISGHYERVKEFMRIAEEWQHENPGCTTGDFLDWIVDFSPVEEISKSGAVNVLTIHSAKGLEWETVFIAGASDGIIPLWQGDPEEERRLMYVAVTRAKKNAVITFPASVKGVPADAGRFIEEMEIEQEIKNGRIEL